MRRTQAITGALVADAASLGLHWLYDQDHLRQIGQTGDVLFRQPDAEVFRDRKGFFAHAGKLAGELSHYGESARVVAQLAKEQGYDPLQHQQLFMRVFGPCGTYCGYADRPTKALIARIISEGEELPARSGMDDNQMPAFCVVSGLFAEGYNISTIESAAAVISTNNDVIDGIRIVTQCMSLIIEGADLTDALYQSAEDSKSGLRDLLQEALSMDTYQPLQAASHFGLACYVHHSLPVVWHLLKHATDFETVVRDNVRCAGDSCGRAMALGAIAGIVYDIPGAMTSRLSVKHLQLN